MPRRPTVALADPTPALDAADAGTRTRVPPQPGTPATEAPPHEPRARPPLRAQWSRPGPLPILRRPGRDTGSGMSSMPGRRYGSRPCRTRTGASTGGRAPGHRTGSKSPPEYRTGSCNPGTPRPGHRSIGSRTHPPGSRASPTFPTDVACIEIEGESDRHWIAGRHGQGVERGGRRVPLRSERPPKLGNPCRPRSRRGL